MSDQLLQQLERTRAGYDVECEWHAFLTDSYSGGGGYQGSVRQPEVGWWGAMATRYWDSSRDAVTRQSSGAVPRNYLDRYGREDEQKFRSRLNVSHLWNFVGPLTDLKLSYLLRKPLTPQDRPKELDEWREDVDGLGTTWDELRPLVALISAIVGWCPVAIDMSPASPGMSRAQADAAGVARPRAIPLTPANLVDYAHDGTRFLWAKLRTDHVEQLEWNAPPTQVSEYRIWSPDYVDVYQVRQEDGKDKTVTPLGSKPHPFKQVPIAIFRHAAMPGDKVVGLPMHGGPSRAQKRLYNLTSELDEHMRQQVFAVLVLATKQTPSEITLGTDNALTLDPESKQEHYYLSPDAGIAATYEARIEATIREGIYRPARVEFARATASATSGVARAYEFAATNRAIADFAGELARAEEWMDSIVWAGLGKSPDALEGYAISAAQDFGVEDLSAEIKNTLDALTANLGVTMTKRIKMRLAERLDPQMPPDVRAQVEAELEEVAAQEEADAAAQREMRDAALEQPEPGEGEEGDETEDEELTD